MFFVSVGEIVLRKQSEAAVADAQAGTQRERISESEFLGQRFRIGISACSESMHVIPVSVLQLPDVGFPDIAIVPLSDYTQIQSEASLT